MIEVIKIPQPKVAYGEAKLVLKAPKSAELVSKVSPKASEPEKQDIQPKDAQNNKTLFEIY